MKIKSMSTLEQLQAMEPLPSSLVNEAAETDSPSWHRDVLVERKAKIEGGDANFISLDALRAYRS